jgi:hypothetical protein
VSRARGAGRGTLEGANHDGREKKGEIFLAFEKNTFSPFAPFVRARASRELRQPRLLHRLLHLEGISGVVRILGNRSGI